MEIKTKAKIHPSPSSSPSTSSIFKLLPSAILTLISVLSLEEREVLAYMITRSMKSSSSSSSSSSTLDFKKKSTRKSSIHGHGGNNNIISHKTPMFDCDCFYCYTNYWFRWDSSPNRELIHQAIEAFEDHLTSGEKPKRNSGKGKRRDKLRRQLKEESPPLDVDDSVVVSSPSEIVPVMEVTGVGEEENKGLATKVLPDVLGFFNSRLWSLWSPNL